MYIDLVLYKQLTKHQCNVARHRYSTNKHQSSITKNQYNNID